MRIHAVFRKCAKKSLFCTKVILSLVFSLVFFAGTVQAASASLAKDGISAVSAAKETGVQKSDSRKDKKAASKDKTKDSEKNARQSQTTQAKHKKKTEAKKPAAGSASSRGLHGATFGFETQRSKSYWSNNGIDGEALMNHAVKSRKKKSAQKPGTAVQQTPSHPENKKGMQFSVESEKSDWRALPGEKLGEDVGMKGQHRMRAFATSEEDDLSLGLGPEVIVRDRQNTTTYTQDPSQPDVDAGVGMRMEYSW